MELLKMIKDLQAVLMATEELPHVVNVRLLARLDEAERHLPQPQAPKLPEVELTAVSEKKEEELEDVK